MQQAYRSLRIVAEAQTIRIVLAPEPDELMLKELCIACESLHTESSSGIKAVVLDFNPTASQLVSHSAQITTDRSSTFVESACAAVRAISQPVLAVVRATLSQTACLLIQAADLTLVAEHAVLILSNEEADEEDTLAGVQAARMGYVTWSAPANDISKHMERILGLLRAKSAVALRYTKASVRLAETDQATRLEALQQVNTIYLTQLMQTHDAQEGLQAFLEKRNPTWKNM
jgi:enoyl-CoA hydratase/carnithine racemase